MPTIDVRKVKELPYLAIWELVIGGIAYGSSKPDNVKHYSVLSVIVTLLVMIVSISGVSCFVVWVTNFAPVDNFKKSQKFQAALEKLIATHQPYGIFLRDFRSETLPIIPTLLLQ